MRLEITINQHSLKCIQPLDEQDRSVFFECSYGYIDELIDNRSRLEERLREHGVLNFEYTVNL